MWDLCNSLLICYDSGLDKIEEEFAENNTQELEERKFEHFQNLIRRNWHSPFYIIESVK